MGDLMFIWDSSKETHLSIFMLEGDLEDDSNIKLAVKVSLLLSPRPFCYLNLIEVGIANLRLLLKLFYVFREYM